MNSNFPDPTREVDGNGLPAVKDGLLAVKDGLPAVKDGLPLVKDGLPLVKDGLPLVKDGLPLVKDGLPLVKDGLLTVQDANHRRLARGLPRPRLERNILQSGCAPLTSKPGVIASKTPRAS